MNFHVREPLQILSNLFVIPFHSFSNDIHPNVIALPTPERMNLIPWISVVNIRIVGRPLWNDNFVAIPSNTSSGAILSEQTDVKAKKGDVVLVNSTLNLFQ